jgi:hypothetical protein
MKEHKSIVLALMLLANFLIASTASAQTGGSYDLTWSTIDGGGTTLSGGGYTLAGTIGQPDVGPSLTGGDYNLVGGLWPGGAVEYAIYLPVALSNS